MAPRRRAQRPHEGQGVFDLWGLSEQQADQSIEQARTAPPAPVEQQLVDGQLDFNFDEDTEVRDEPVRDARTRALDEVRTQQSGAAGEPGRVLREPGGAGTVPDGIIPGGINEPGPWGGYENGRIPENTLSPIPWKPEYVLRADATQALIALNNAYRAQFGQDLVVNDGYRDYDEQARAKEIYGSDAATPGQSNHGWALAVDVGIFSFYSLEYTWMDQNAPRFGWRNPDWARPGGRGPIESWHWEFWGVAA